MAFDITYVRGQLPERRIDWRQTIASTMPEAVRLAQQGCRSGTLVGADEQTAGYGRQGRPWHSAAGHGLYVSVVLRFPFPPDSLPVLAMAIGLAVQESIQQTAGIACDLRWPNDVLIHDKKCAGILTQLEGNAVIAGIGVNVNHAGFPPEIARLATSLRIASGRAHSREDLLIALLPAIDSLCALLGEQGKGGILDMFAHASSYVFDRRVTVDQGDATITGTTAGLNDSGYLLVRGDDGKQNVIIAGGVRPCY